MSESGFEGDPVELYLLLRDVGESEVVHSAIPPGAAILELGCGAGRMTRALLALGHPVTAIDQDAEMVRHLPVKAEPIVGSIEDLQLADQYPAVLLASNLVNTPSRGTRSLLLASCRRHVASSGVVVIQRYRPNLEDWQVGEWEHRGPVEIRISHFERRGSTFTASIEYRHGDTRWAQRFTAEVLEDDELAQELARADLRLVDFLDPDTTWVMAEPLSDSK